MYRAIGGGGAESAQGTNSSECWCMSEICKHAIYNSRHPAKKCGGRKAIQLACKETKAARLVRAQNAN